MFLISVFRICRYLAALAAGALLIGCSSHMTITKSYGQRTRMSKPEAVQFLKRYLRNEKNLAVDENRLAFTYQKKIIDNVRESGLGVYGLGSKTIHTIYHIEDFHVNIVYEKVVNIYKVSSGNREYLHVYDRKGTNLSGGFDWVRIDDSFISALLALCPNVEAGPSADPSNEIYLAITEGNLAKLSAMLERNPEFVGYKTDYGTPLYIAAGSGNREAAALLIAKGAKVDELTIKIGGQYAPLHAAAENGRRDMTEFLLANGADANVRTDKGFTPLHMAASSDRRDVAQLLVAKGADVNAAGNTGATPLFSAAEKNRLEIARLLINSNADVNLPTRQGWTPLHVCTEHGFRDMLEFLAAKGAEIKVKSKSGYTPLHLASAHNRRDAAEALIRLGASLNAKNRDGSTPLHLAAGKNYVDVVNLLITKGADMNARDRDDRTPLYVATKEKRWEAANLLRKSGGIE